MAGWELGSKALPSQGMVSFMEVMGITTFPGMEVGLGVRGRAVEVGTEVAVGTEVDVDTIIFVGWGEAVGNDGMD